jgi:hypothetical protein
VRTLILKNEEKLFGLEIVRKYPCTALLKGASIRGFPVSGAMGLTSSSKVLMLAMLKNFGFKMG